MARKFKIGELVEDNGGCAYYIGGVIEKIEGKEGDEVRCVSGVLSKE